MARMMKKFSAGGAQGRYDRRMADIEKDYKKAMTRKTGKDAEVAEAKRQQRIADAKDDLAKRTGADRTATRAAERTAESNLKKTRKYGAPKSVTTEVPVAKITETLSVPKMDSSIGAKPVVKKPVPKPVQKPADKTPVKVQRNYNISPENRKAIDAAAKKEPFTRTDTKALSDLKTGKNSYGAAKFGKAATAAASATKTDTGAKDNTAAGRRQRMGAVFSALNPFSYIPNDEEYTKRQEAKYGKAKGGKIMKYAKGGSTPPQPSAAERKADAKFRESIKNIKVTPEQGKILNKTGKKYAAGGVTKEMPSSKGMGSLDMAKGGKAKAKPAAKGKGKPFAATKFGAALMKKSADTKGRAMPKFAKGGSIDGCAVKGKTKASMVKMARGGAAKMRGRDSYGGAEFKKGGKTC